MSFTELQVKESFSSREQLNGFVSMITTGVENSMTVKLDALIMRAINNMTGETLVAGIGSGTAGAKSYPLNTLEFIFLLFSSNILSSIFSLSSVLYIVTGKQN